jgi:hypothetical protein
MQILSIKNRKFYKIERYNNSSICNNRPIFILQEWLQDSNDLFPTNIEKCEENTLTSVIQRLLFEMNRKSIFHMFCTHKIVFNLFIFFLVKINVVLVSLSSYSHYQIFLILPTYIIPD